MNNDIIISLTFEEALDYIERVRQEFIGTSERIDPISILSDKIERAVNELGIVLPDRVVSK